MSETHDTPFPDHFLWGAATSAYQIEGSPLADGAGPSIWHRFAHMPGRVRDGDTGDVACDHYRRWEEDVRLMREIGLTAYRFSVSWGRVIPTGTGPVNSRGLDFYRRLVDALLASGIRPFVTLYHWDLPAALEDRGGWLNRDIALWFGDYTTAVVRALDDRVEFWATLNEPWVVADGGYLHGVMAPGRRSLVEAPRASHNLLRAHAAAVAAYRAAGRHRVGLVVNLEPKCPASQRSSDLAAASRSDAYTNRHYLDPVFLGAYPSELPEIFGEAWPEWPASDLDEIRQPIDFLGVNYYTRSVVRGDKGARPLRAAAVRQAGRPHTEMGWEVYPEGLTAILLWLTKRYGKVPLYVTENGASFADAAPRGGRVEDPLRVQYLHDHLCAASAAIRQGADLRGYFVWSLLDNFEWQNGYSKRFGIVHVDFTTQRRTPKASANFFRNVISTHGAALAAPRV